MRKFLPLRSSKLIALWYDTASQELITQFDADTYYLYEPVEPALVLDVIFADSHGKAFHELIETPALKRTSGISYLRMTREEAIGA